jgi:hypothetical protein
VLGGSLLAGFGGYLALRLSLALAVRPADTKPVREPERDYHGRQTAS